MLNEDEIHKEQNPHDDDNIDNTLNPSEENEGYDAVHVENMKCENEKSNQVELDLYDPGKWKNINSNLRDLF